MLSRRLVPVPVVEGVQQQNCTGLGPRRGSPQRDSLPFLTVHAEQYRALPPIGPQYNLSISSQRSGPAKRTGRLCDPDSGSVMQTHVQQLDP